MLDFKCNYKNKNHTDLFCSVCQDSSSSDRQEHLLDCVSLTDSQLVQGVPKYEDLFSPDFERQKVIAYILNEKYQKRNKLLQSRKWEHNFYHKMWSMWTRKTLCSTVWLNCTDWNLIIIIIQLYWWIQKVRNHFCVWTVSWAICDQIEFYQKLFSSQTNHRHEPSNSQTNVDHFL